jgi:hypothetical protein
VLLAATPTHNIGRFKSVFRPEQADPRDGVYMWPMFRGVLDGLS